MVNLDLNPLSWQEGTVQRKNFENVCGQFQRQLQYSRLQTANTTQPPNNCPKNNDKQEPLCPTDAE